MSTTLSIISALLLTSIGSYSQQPVVVDSTIRSFTVKLREGDVCNNTDAVSFDVFPNRTQFEPAIYVAKQDILPFWINKKLFYTISGYVVTKKEWISGCGSARWEELRTYLIPAQTTVFIKRKLTPYVHF